MTRMTFSLATLATLSIGFSASANEAFIPDSLPQSTAQGLTQPLSSPAQSLRSTLNQNFSADPKIVPFPAQNKPSDTHSQPANEIIATLLEIQRQRVQSGA